ncbi:MAG: putative diguanylate cyclase with, partial [Tardiphaga sp.]|nr:putative diguanylate cyclase with [Tardiphaga sp.]
MRGELGFDSFTANIAVLDSAGRIVAVNPAWRAFGEKNGLKHPDACLGANYLEVCKASNVPRELIEELSDLLGGRQSVLSHWYPCHAPDRKRWFIMFGVRQAESHTVALFHVEVTDWMGPSTVEQLDFEKPDRLIDNRIQLSVEAALARLLPALLGKIDRGGHRTPRAG